MSDIVIVMPEREALENLIRNLMEPEIKKLVAETENRVKDFAAKWSLSVEDVHVVIGTPDPAVPISLRGKKKY